MGSAKDKRKAKAKVTKKPGAHIKRPSGRSGWLKYNEARKAAKAADLSSNQPSEKQGRLIEHDIARLETIPTKSVHTQTDGARTGMGHEEQKHDEADEEGYEGDVDDRKKNWSRNLFDEAVSPDTAASETR